MPQKLIKRLVLPCLFTGLIIGIVAFLNLTPGTSEFHRSLLPVSRLLLIAAGSWVIIRLITIGRILLLKQVDLQAEDNLEARRVYTQIRVIERLLIAAVIVVGIAMALMSFDRMRQVGVSLIASAGVIGIIVGFAAQKSIATVLAGLQIALTQPIRMDDVVIVEGEWGRIEEITLTYVVVKIWDQRRLIVPITYFLDNPFQNWTRTSAEILGTVFVYTDYTVPVESVRAQLHQILTATPLWDGRAWCLQVTNSTERTMELRALMSARSSGDAWELRCIVREQLIDYLQQQFPNALPKSRIEMDSLT